MKYSIRYLLSCALVISSLLLFSSCQWFKEKTTCPECPSQVEQKEPLTGEPLLVVKGKPLITVNSFEDFWSMFTESNPNAQLMASINPQIREGLFKNNLVPLKLARAWAENEGKTATEEFQKKLRRQSDFIADCIALDLLRDEIMKEIDKSDAALKKYYEESKEEIGATQGAPFIKKPAGVQAKMVEFATEQEAKTFLEKAQKEGANFEALVKEINKEIKDLGIVTQQTEDLDPSIKMRVVDMTAGEVAQVDVDKDKFVVVKAVSKQEPEYAAYEELKDQPQVRETIEQMMLQKNFTDLLNKKLEEIKKAYNVEENLKFFEREREQKQAELQEQLKKLQAEQEKEAPPKASDEAPQKKGSPLARSQKIKGL